MVGHLHLFIYLFAINTKTIAINMYHIIIKLVNIIGVIKIDEWAASNRHCTCIVLSMHIE